MPQEWSPRRPGEVRYGIDFDDTYTTCPAAFDAFIIALKAAGHTPYFVTFRDGGIDDIIHHADRLGIGLVATDGQKKHEAMEDCGVTVDVWIDDMPWLIYED